MRGGRESAMCLAPSVTREHGGSKGVAEHIHPKVCVANASPYRGVDHRIDSAE